MKNLSDEIKNNAREKLKSLKQVEKYIEGGLKQKRALELCGISKIEILESAKHIKKMAS